MVESRIGHTLFAGLRVVGINTAILLTGLVGLELAFGHWFVDHVVPDPKLIGRSFDFVQTAYQPHSRVAFTRDIHGLRTRWPTSSVQILTIGGSTTAQNFITDGETWQDVIEERTGLRLANAGIDGMSTQSVPEILEDWLHRIPGLKPRYVLHYIGINDAAMVQTVPISERKPKFSWTRRIRGRSAVLQAISRMKDALRGGGPDIMNHSAVAPQAPAKTPWHSPNVDLDAIRRYVEVMYKPNLEAVINTHRRRGEFPIVVTQAANPDWVTRRDGELLVASPEFSRWAVALDMINAATIALCRENSAHCAAIDLAKELPLEQSDFHDLVHNTPAGSRKIGEFLARKLDFVRDETRR